MAARAVEGFPEGEPADGVRLLTYANEMADRYDDAEFDALNGLAIFKAMGRPTGYRQGAGYGDFTVAARGDDLIGFCFTQVPEGIIWWMGVAPDERRKGVGRMLVASAARAVRQAGGNVSGAARLLGVSRDVVRYRLKGVDADPGVGENSPPEAG